MTDTVRACAVIAVFLSAGCARRDTGFDEARAWAHVDMLAGTIGSRPIGTPANEAARAYVVGELQRNGFTVEARPADATRPERGATARVFNVIGVAPGPSDEALALIAHYDSVPDGPGAGDDGLGAAVAMEAGRVLAARASRRHTLVVVLTDGEEVGLMGAAGLVQDRALIDRILGYLNLEAVGSGWPAVLFEAGPDADWLIDTWARHAPFPRGASFAVEIYKRLPNDTDFSILHRAGVAGLNVSLIGNSYVYHTDRDDPDHLDRLALTRAGDNAVTILTALDEASSTPAASSAPPIYFDVLGLVGVGYSAETERVLLWTAVVVALVAFVRTARAALRASGARGLVLTAVWMIAGLLLAAIAMTGVTWLLRALGDTLHPWYAHPNYLLLTMLAAGGSAALVAGHAAWSGRWHGCGHPSAVWSVVLPVWMGLAVAFEVTAPTAGFMWTLPLLAAGVVLAVGPLQRRASARMASLIVFGLVGALWIPNALDLYEFLFSIFARERMVTPVWIYPVFVLFCGLMLALPLVAVLCGLSRERTRRHLAICALGLVVAFPMACNAPAYTSDRPLRRHVRYVQDDTTNRAVWEIGGNEPALDVGPAPELSWAPAVRPPTPILPPFDHPFVYHANAPARVAAPVNVTTVIEAMGGQTRLSATIVPADAGLSVTLVLPPGLTPQRPNFPGVLDARGAWRATFIGVPAEGVTFTAFFDGGQNAPWAETRLIVQAPRLPDLDGGAPSWLPTRTAAWTRRSFWVLPLSIED